VAARRDIVEVKFKARIGGVSDTTDDVALYTLARLHLRTLSLEVGMQESGRIKKFRTPACQAGALAW
jgi:hypothetical protein